MSWARYSQNGHWNFNLRHNLPNPFWIYPSPSLGIRKIKDAINTEQGAGRPTDEEHVANPEMYLENIVQFRGSRIRDTMRTIRRYNVVEVRSMMTITSGVGFFVNYVNQYNSFYN